MTSAGAQHREGRDVTDTGLGRWPRTQPCAPSEHATGAWATQADRLLVRPWKPRGLGTAPRRWWLPSCGTLRPSPATLVLPPA